MEKHRELGRLHLIRCKPNNYISSMSHNYVGFVFAITADCTCLSLVYLVDGSVTISLYFLTHSASAFCENTIHLVIRKINYFSRKILQEKICQRKAVCKQIENSEAVVSDYPKLQYT